ncbi:MAG TPA: M14 family metallopeptidase [Thermoanaerobaculia bacterium]|nr:M14 family metallopeptidase [Thermoanaerobaculia bacterium]
MRRAAVFCLALLAFRSATRGEQPIFRVGTAAAAQGHRATGFIEVPAGSDPALRIPVIVFHGAWEGKVLAIVSGAHGTEYASILAAEKLIDRIDPTELSGSVILVPLVNLASFEQKVVHVNPTDGKSMNRFYPGRADGTQSERTAYAITHQVVDACDYLIDLHGGDLDESLRPYSYWPKTGSEKVDSVSREMALAFGLDHIIVAGDRPKDPNASRFLDSTATTRGKPAIAAEAGYAGRSDPEDVEALIQGCLSVLRLVKMLPGVPRRIEHPVWLDSIRTVTSEQTGIFYPLVKRGSYVEQGMRLGYVTDYFNNTVLEARAPAAGVVLYIGAVPSMKKGDTIANIGVVARTSP